MNSEARLRAALRRIRPEKHDAPLVRRADSDIPLANLDNIPGGQYLLDTTVHIHAGQGKLPDAVRLILRNHQVWNSSVGVAELSHTLGVLDPADPRTPGRWRFIRDVLARMPAHRIVTPDNEIWMEAGIFAGTLTRTQGLGRADRRKLFNDALVLLCARKNGLRVLTADLADFDLMTQVRPDCEVLFYRPV